LHIFTKQNPHHSWSGWGALGRTIILHKTI